MAPGADVLAGAFSDRDLGSVMALSLGGRHAGLAETVVFRLPPATDVEADELIDSSGGVVSQLEGFPGTSALDRESLREVILRFALLGEVPEVAEADLNPYGALRTAASCSTCGCESSASAPPSAARRGDGGD